MNVTGQTKALGSLPSRYVDFLHHSHTIIHQTLKSSDHRSATIHRSLRAMQSLKTSSSGKVIKYRIRLWLVSRDGNEGVKSFSMFIFADLRCKNKFWGKSMEIFPIGTTHVHLLR